MTIAAIGPRQKKVHRRHLWPELFAVLEWASLKTSPAYYGIGVPRGDGAPVILVPGFLGSDLSLMEMRAWLRRIGYRPYLSGIGRNDGCPDVLLERLLETIDRAYRETGSKVRLIGHSLGGLLARAAAVRRPRHVAQVITLASPFRRLSAHPFVLTLISLVRGKALKRDFGNAEGSCECSFLEAIKERMPDSLTCTAIYTRTDPVVDWRDCVENDQALNVEVHGTHVGLPSNPAVYKEVSRLLAEPVSQRKPDSISPRSEPGLKRAA